MSGMPHFAKGIVVPLAGTWIETLNNGHRIIAGLGRSPRGNVD